MQILHKAKIGDELEKFKSLLSFCQESQDDDSLLNESKLTTCRSQEPFLLAYSLRLSRLTSESQLNTYYLGRQGSCIDAP